MRIQQKDRVLQSIAALRADNYSYGAIAEKFGMSANTVKSLCKRYNIKAGSGKVISKLRSGDTVLHQVCRFANMFVI